MVLSFDVTRRKLVLGSRDSTTGWRATSYSESTIEIINLGKGITVMDLGAGQYARVSEVGQTADPVVEGDQIIHQGTYYHAEYVKEVFAPGDNFHHRDVGLVRLPMFEAPPTSVSSVKDRASDARSNTKSYIDVKVRSSQITKNDDSTLASWTCIYEDPPYHLSREFRAASNSVQGLYVVSQPNSTPLIQVGRAVHGYDEQVPIHICAVDSTDVTGTVLQWKMEAELRYVLETYPIASYRSLDRRASHDRALGSMWLYDAEFVLNYRRVK